MTEAVSRPANPPDFSIGHPNRILDFFYRAVHLTNVDAKALVNAFYSEAPGSILPQWMLEGRRQVLAEVQRFPGDFDGILGGDASNAVTLLDGFVWDTQAIGVTEAGPAAGLLPPATYRLFRLRSCPNARKRNSFRRISSSMIRDNATSTLRRSVHRSADSGCLTQAQINGVQAVLSGPTTRFGLPIAPGYEPEFSVWTQLGSLAPGAGVQTFFAQGIFGKLSESSLDAQQL